MHDRTSIAHNRCLIAAATVAISLQVGIATIHVGAAMATKSAREKKCNKVGQHRPRTRRRGTRQAVSGPPCKPHRARRSEAIVETQRGGLPIVVDQPARPEPPLRAGEFEQPEPVDPSPPQEPSPVEPPNEEALGEAAAPFRFFSPTSFWNMPPAPDAPLDPESVPLVDTFNAEVYRELANQEGPGISTTAYSVPVYTVPADQPMVRVQLAPQTPAPALQAALSQVPLPPDAQPAAGTDGSLVLWQPSSDRLWEFWRLARGDAGWLASWGGAMQNVSSGPGVYMPGVWPEAKSWWGPSASSLSIAGGLITLEDLQRGQIDHALAIAIPNVRAGVYSSPAQRTDGKSTSPLSLPEGAHLRLDPNLDLSTLAMPRITRMIAEAAQRYGIFVRDGARVAHFFAQDPVNATANPYIGPRGYFESQYPGRLLASFPWSHLQLLAMELHAQR